MTDANTQRITAALAASGWTQQQERTWCHGRISVHVWREPVYLRDYPADTPDQAKIMLAGHFPSILVHCVGSSRPDALLRALRCVQGIPGTEEFDGLIASTIAAIEESTP